MAKKAPLILGAAAVAIAAGVFFTTVTDSDSGGIKRDVVDQGGGQMAVASQTPEPFAITTLPPVGNAAQDPGGGGGGGGSSNVVGPPGKIGPLAGGTTNVAGLGPNLYFSGTNLLDPNRSATTSGDNTFPTPLSTVGGVIGPILDPLGGTAGGSATGCATTPDSVDYYAIPLQIEKVGFSGTPTVHLRISGSGTVTVRLYQQNSDESCSLLSAGSANISGGVANVTLGARRNFQFAYRSVPALVIQAAGTHTISTSSGDPSVLTLPGLTGV